jgi:hypothetical protein
VTSRKKGQAARGRAIDQRHQLFESAIVASFPIREKPGYATWGEVIHG